MNINLFMYERWENLHTKEGVRIMERQWVGDLLGMCNVFDVKVTKEEAL